MNHFEVEYLDSSKEWFESESVQICMRHAQLHGHIKSIHRIELVPVETKVTWVKSIDELKQLLK